MTDSKKGKHKGGVTRMTNAGGKRRPGAEASRRPRPQERAAKGPRQPLRVGTPSTVNSVVALLQSDPLDKTNHVLLQIVKTRLREPLLAIDFAHALTRFVRLLKAEGRSQQDAADDLDMSRARLSKYLALAKAPQEIQDLSSHGAIQDVEFLYLLKKAHDEQPKETTKLLAQWRAKELTMPLRQAVAQVREKPRPTEPPPPTEAGGSPDASYRTTQHHQPTTASAVQTVSVIDLQVTETDTRLMLDVGKKKYWFSLDPDMCRRLKQLARKL